MFIKYRKIIIALIAIVAVIIAALVIMPTIDFKQSEDVTPPNQVVVSGRIISFTDVGILVELSEESSFSTLLVEIRNDDLPERFYVGNYIDIYYNGVIIDESPAKFQLIYNITQSNIEQEEIKTYSDWNIPNSFIGEVEEYELTEVTSVIQSHLAMASNTSLVNINAFLGSINSEQDTIDAYLCLVQYNGTSVEEWKVIYILKQENNRSVINTETVELMKP